MSNPGIDTFDGIPENAIYMDNEELAKPTKVKKLPVMEIFGPTIQGEGFMIGERTSFIRFGYCDYKCKFCDSMHAVDPERVKANAERLTPEEITKRLIDLHIGSNGITNANWVTFSGGNPCMHDLYELVLRVREEGLKIAVETQGTLLPSWLHMCDVITVSPKAPGMGEKYEPEKFLQFILQFKYHSGFNVKIVVFSMADMEWATEINQLMIEEGLEDRVYFSLGNRWPPGLDAEVTPYDLQMELLRDYKVLVEDFLQMPQLANVKFLPQLHVLTWANKQKV